MFIAKLHRSKSKARLGVGIHRGTARAWQESLCACVPSCIQLCDPMDCSPLGSSVHGIFQAKILEWGAISSSRGSSPPRDRMCESTQG